MFAQIFNHKEHKAHKEKTLCSLACGRAGFVAFVVQFWLRPKPRNVIMEEFFCNPG